MKRYRFYCGLETSAGDNVRVQTYRKALRGLSVKAWTEFSATGEWEGKLERSVVFEIIGDLPLTPATLSLFLSLAGSQKAVLYTQETVEGELIERRM